jgi:hypothetical protein
VEEFRYAAYRTVQSQNGTPLLLFSAPAVEIESWAGVPQRGRLHGEETVGFQRERNETRVRALQRFFQDSRNVVQNPLLAALQDTDAVWFEPLDDGGVFGELVIRSSNMERAPLVELLRLVTKHLYERVPDLRGRRPLPNRATEIFDEFIEANNIESSRLLDYGDDESNTATATDGDMEGDGDPDASSVLLFEETNIVDFYDELLGRIEVLERLDPSLNPR